MAYRKNFIFHDKVIVDHIENQPNQSRYMESLVKEDITVDKTDYLSKALFMLKNEVGVIKEDMVKAISELLYNRNTLINQTPPKKLETNVSSSIQGILDSLE